MRRTVLPWSCRPPEAWSSCGVSALRGGPVSRAYCAEDRAAANLARRHGLRRVGRRLTRRPTNQGVSGASLVISARAGLCFTTHFRCWVAGHFRSTARAFQPRSEPSPRACAGRSAVSPSDWCHDLEPQACRRDRRAARLWGERVLVDGQQRAGLWGLSWRRVGRFERGRRCRRWREHGRHEWSRCLGAGCR